ncbi:hypothetical protein [Gymnodinialimonas ceratoperidinii]|uniref:Uncharacterized protein n=1 Tax=Gymnodinialimonas ceratoperidinii TaxID=2856823 RepID=A0A8F6TYY5_9RHOB|nr:hypothetical protein [Gymnodinialimonas ceratoperidinii]QXT41225.1 hypothetical protein KYE46_08455 [Gymnodinialimonas ceratoperidinii]
MPHATKIATCCYCGRRQMLRPTARDGHELACGACGAPLHEMKWLKPPEARGAQVKRSPERVAPHGHRPDDRAPQRPQKAQKKRKKRRKPLWQKALEEAFDVIEDIFD